MGKLKQREAPIVLVTDPSDDEENAPFVRQLHNLDLGQAVVEISSDPHSVRHIGFDVLTALGKNPDALGAGRNGTEIWNRGQLWLQTLQVEHLIVWRAHLLRPMMIAEFAKLAFAARVRMWLLVQGRSLTLSKQARVDDWPHIAVSFEQFRATWTGTGSRGSEAASPPVAEEDQVVFPEVPLEDFTTFRAAAFDLLELAEFEEVDQVWRASREAAEAWIAGVDELDELRAAGYLREVLAPAQTLSELLTRLRGAQVAFFLQGWLVRADLDLVAAQVDRPRVKLEPWVCRVLAAYSTPRITAAAMIAIGTELSPQEIVDIDVGDVGADGSIHRGKYAWSPPRDAAPLLDALVLQRVLEGARPADPLFVYTRGTGVRHAPLERWTPKGLHDMLKRIEHETGLLITSHWTPRGRENDVSWTRRRGLLVQRL